MSSAKILVMDDEVNIRLFLKETLANEGYEVVTAESGEEALQIISRETFDLALLDLHLPGIGGMEVLAAMRQQTPDTIVIILTAHATLETAVEALRRGASDYLFKPCKPVQLRESIRKGLLKRQQNLIQQNLIHQLEQYLVTSFEDYKAALGSSSPEALPEPTPLADQPLLTLGESVENEGRFLKRGQLIVDFPRHVITVDGHLLELSPTEFDLLAYLISEAPKVITAQKLIREVLGYTSDVWEARDLIRQHIYHLRQKVKEATGRTDVIRTARGVGYAINVEE